MERHCGANRILPARSGDMQIVAYRIYHWDGLSPHSTSAFGMSYEWKPGWNKAVVCDLFAAPHEKSCLDKTYWGNSVVTFGANKCGFHSLNDLLECVK